MEKIKLAFLGTGDAIPTKKRNHTAILLTYKNENILVDCGEGTQRQLKIAKISPAKITRILITHKHGDHTFGLPGLFYTLAMNKYSKTLEVYGPKGIKSYINQIKKLGSELRIKMKIKEVRGKFLETPDFYIEAKPMKHKVPCNAYSFIVKDKIRLNKAKLKKLKLPHTPLLKKLQCGKDITIKGKKIKAKHVTYLEKGKKITFILDTSMNKNAIPLAKNSDILISEATFSSQETKRAKEYKHLTSEQAATIAKKSKSKKLILTHVSQRHEKDLSQIEKQAEKIFKNTTLAKDFFITEI